VRRASCLIVLLFSLAGAGAAAADSHDWLRYGRDDQLTNAAPEFLAPRLSTGTVGRLAPLWTVKLDGAIVASPLYVRAVTVEGRSQDLVYAATEGGSVYALRRGTGDVLWQRRLGTTGVCEEEAPGGQYGISSTPVIDRTTQTLYVIGASGFLHALDLASGGERPGWPLMLLPHPDGEHVWGGLTLSKGRAYVPVASYCDDPDPAGHIAEGQLIAVDVAQRRVVANFDVVPGPENLGGIWGYGGTSVDPGDGTIWTATGNSWVFDPECGCVNEGVGYAESIVKLSPDLTVLDSDRPPELPSPIVEDTDFGSTPLLFQPQGCPPLAAAHSKNGKVYVWVRSSLATGPIWELRIGPDDLAQPFIGEPSWSEQLQTMFISNARIYGPAGVVRFDAAVGIRVGDGCRFPDGPTWIADAGNGTKPPPLVLGNLLFVPGGLATALYALDARDGAVLATLELDGPDFSSPILADGTILAGDVAGEVHAFDVDGGCPMTLHAFGGHPSCDA
jgi:outer membrane protein assembly factor BamB